DFRLQTDDFRLQTDDFRLQTDDFRLKTDDFRLKTTMTERLNLVTGASGFTGTYLVRDLLRDGQQVLATDLPGTFDTGDRRQRARSLGLDLDHPNLEFVPSDLLDPESLRPLFERPVTHLFHTASLYDYSATLDRLRRVNVDGTRHLLDAILDSDVELERFIHWSTCGVFGKPHTAAEGDQVNLPFNERSPSPKTTAPTADGPTGTDLVNDYSVSKWEQEKMIWRMYREKDLPVTVVRPAPIYGPGSAYGHGGIILAIALGFVPAIPADSKNYITTSVHVQDVAGFARYIAEQDDAIGEDYNIVDNSIISYHEFLHYIALLTGRRMHDVPLVKMDQLMPLMRGAAKTWRWLEREFGIPRVRVFEIQSANYMSSSYWLSNRKSLDAGYEYTYPDVKEGLKDTVAWFREMGWLTDMDRAMVVNPEGSKPS
ncbi:MAG: NAD-dependent epimerase/dehydratase family protein, partial [Bradymonadaceae bacterium]